MMTLPDLETALQGETATMSAIPAVNSALDLAMARHDNLLYLGEDVADPIGGVFKATKGLSTKYGDHRVRATPISEQAIVGSAIGAALSGYRTVAEIMFFDFINVAMDQIINHAAKFRYMSGGHSSVPMTIFTMIGESRFGAQHSQSLEAWFMHTPGIKVVFPSTPLDYKGLMAASIEDPDPCLFIGHIHLAYSSKVEVPTGEYQVPLGKAHVAREGDDVTLIAYGPEMPKALQAAETLSEQGVSVEVIDLRSLVPLDFDTVLTSVGRTGRAVVLHEATRFCGPGAEIASVLHEELFGQLHAPVRRLGAAYAPRPFAKNLALNPSADDVVDVVAKLATT